MTDWNAAFKMTGAPQPEEGRVPTEEALPEDIVIGRDGERRKKLAGPLGKLGLSVPEGKGILSTLIGGMWGDLTSAPRDDSGKAMLKSMGFLDGATRATLAEVAKRVATAGEEGIGSEDWAAVRRGEAPGTNDLLKKHAGVNAPITGFLADVLLSPAGAFYGGKFNEANKRLAPLSGIAHHAGFKTHKQAFRDADAGFTGWKGAVEKYGPEAFSRRVWNDGSPIVGGASVPTAKIPDQVKNLRRNAWSQMEEIQGSTPGHIDIGPGVTDVVNESARSAAEKIKIKVARRAFNHIKSKPGVADEDKIKAARGFAQKLDSAYRDPNNRFFTRIRRTAADRAQLDTQRSLLSGLGGGTNQRADSVKRIKEMLLPEFHDLVDEKAGQLANANSAEQAMDWFQKILKDASEGKRPLDSVQDLISSWGEKAAGSVPLGTNAFKVSGKTGAQKGGQVGTRGTLASLMEDAIDKMGGEGAGEAFRAAKKDYGIFAKAEPIVAKLAEKSDKAPAMSKVDFFMALRSLFAGNMAQTAKEAIPWVGAKFGQTVGRNPRVATTLGKAMATGSKGGNIWERIANQGLIQPMLREDENGSK